ncbi:MAG: molybdopterin-dependent oxidoreductase [Planctomycetota bacterium]
MSELLSRRDVLIGGAGLLAVSQVGAPERAIAAPQDALGKELEFLTTDPARNGQPALDQLVKSWITPTKHFYVRSHAPNPVIDPDAFRLKIEGSVSSSTSISLAELKDRFKSHTVTATLTCAGNRRNEFNEEGKVGGVQWGAGAIGNATWTGVSLADVLTSVSPTEEAKHVWFEGLDQIERSGGVIPFGGSVPIQKAMINGEMPGALLAYEMNGKPLTPDHGFPLRTVVPGYIGARSVKWLGKIVVSDRPSPNHYLATAYKIVKKTDAIDWTESGPIYRYPINGAIATPGAGATVSPGVIEVTGYVLPSGRSGSKVRSVMIKTDDQSKWVRAKLTGTNSDYCWQLWKAKIEIRKETTKLVLRAGDTAGDFMPVRVPWNAKGYLQNSWFELPIQVS